MKGNKILTDLTEEFRDSKIYLGKSDRNERMYLLPPNWSCDWYWSVNCVSATSLHTHMFVFDQLDQSHLSSWEKYDWEQYELLLCANKILRFAKVQPNYELAVIFGKLLDRMDDTTKKKLLTVDYMPEYEFWEKSNIYLEKPSVFFNNHRSKILQNCFKMIVFETMTEVINRGGAHVCPNPLKKELNALSDLRDELNAEFIPNQWKELIALKN